MFVIIIFAVVFLLIGVTLMSLPAMIGKDGRTLKMHIGNSKAMKEKGIHCAMTQDWEAVHRQSLFERLER
jgi:hypothetical protein